MHDETKVNTNDAETSSVDEKKIAISHSWVEHVVDLEHGKLVFSDLLSLQDHTQMRSQQLWTLLRMTYGQHAESFEALGSDNRNNFHWHAHQLAGELDACIVELCSAGKGK